MSNHFPHRISPARIRLMICCLMTFNACRGLRIPEPLEVGLSDWAMFGKDVTRTNASSDVFTPPLTLEWEYDITGGIGNGSVLVVDSVLIAGNLRGELHALNARTGKRLGWADLGEAIQGSPAFDGHVAIIPLSNTELSLVAYDLVEGTSLWRRDYGDLEASPLLRAQKVYVGNTAGTFFCVDPATGDQVWKYELPENARQKGIRSSAAAIGNTIAFGAEDGFLYALDAETGSRRWRYNTGGSIVASPCIAGGNAVIGNLNGIVSAVDSMTGESRWKFAAGASIYASPSYAEGRIFIGTTGGMMYALDAVSGTRLWNTDLGSVINSGAPIVGDILYVGTLRKTLFGLRASDGAIIDKQEVPGRIKTSPVVAHGRLFVATDEKLILAFRSATP